MRPVQHLVCCYLAACVLLAGAIGINPALHQQVEHGGRGPMHTHFGVRPNAVGAAHAHKHIDDHAHPHRHPHPHHEPSKQLFSHNHRPFGLPEISLDPVWHALHLLFNPSGAEPHGPASHEGERDHDHHSLPQMLVSGTVDQPASGAVAAVFISWKFSDFVAPETEVLAREKLGCSHRESRPADSELTRPPASRLRFLARSRTLPREVARTTSPPFVSASSAA